MKTPIKFAQLYIDRKINLPLLHSVNSLSFKTFKKNHILTTIKELNIYSQIKENIYTALLELTQAMFLSTTDLKRECSIMTKKRKDTIKCLEKILEIGYPFQGLSFVNLRTIKEALEKLKDEDRKSGTYHPIKELDYTVTLEKYHQSSGELLYEREDFPQPGKTILTSEPKLTKEGKVYFQSESKLKDLLYVPLKVKEGRTPKFFFKVLQIVVFEYLKKENIPVEKAKSLTAKIINEHFKKIKHPELANLKSKSIDNALH